MKTTERNWSAYEDYQWGNFGQRAFYTRQDWIEQCFDWCYGGMSNEEYEQLDEEEKEYLDWLNKLTDEELMSYIETNWEIGIRETTWLAEGNECYWKDPANETSGIYTIYEIRYDDELAEDTIILIGNGSSEAEVTFNEIYGLTNEVCPKCGKPLYVSDLCAYKYVCLECDENF